MGGVNGYARRLTRLEQATVPPGRCAACGGVCTPTLADVVLRAPDFAEGAVGCQCPSHVCARLVDGLVARLGDGEGGRVSTTNGHARRLEALEAAVPAPIAEGDRDTRQFDALMQGLARLAHVYHQEAQRPPVPGRRPRSDAECSGAELVVRRAMREASAVGEWGTEEYVRRFWGVATRLLRERLDARGAAGS